MAAMHGIGLYDRREEKKKEKKEQNRHHVSEHPNRTDDGNDNEWMTMLSSYDTALAKKHEKRRHIAENASGMENMLR
jgi:hypothetical protein